MDYGPWQGYGQLYDTEYTVDLIGPSGSILPQPIDELVDASTIESWGITPTIVYPPGCSCAEYHYDKTVTATINVSALTANGSAELAFTISIGSPETGEGTPSTITAQVGPAVAVPNIDYIWPNTLTVGTSAVIDIYGENLGDTNQVSVDGAGVTITAINSITDTWVEVSYTVASDAPPGARTLALQTPSGQATSPVQVMAKPVITGISPDTIKIGATNVPITIQGSGFGQSPTVNLPQGFTNNGGQASSDSTIVIFVDVDATATVGANAITVTVNNVISNPATITVILDVSIKLEQVGPTVISTDGKYSEDTTVRVTAVKPDTGETVTNFAGTVNLAEVPATDGTTVYSQNGGTLPSSVSITSSGTVTFVAKSLAGPKTEGASGSKPNPAQIKTTNYPVYGGSALSIPQWVISPTKVDPLAGDGVYDWVQARAKDIFSSATGDVATVLSAVGSYTIAALAEGGHTELNRATHSPITINPYFKASRLDAAGSGSVCGNTMTRWFTNVLLHEARHAYQGAQAAISGNDADLDWLVNSIAVAPTDIFLDTTTSRDVCNQSTATVLSLSYHGDSVADSFGPPDNANYALEMDAWVFASSHDR